ncbi:unnamed protein product [Oikopleura dioica]|uniref:Uncharacterized protein n=1 Tax=Oikopleura dioica TaxID=34765 RepID=E4XCN1_OIKDI|nr:unnamed protein product [Oikopleura dioica]
MIPEYRSECSVSLLQRNDCPRNGNKGFVEVASWNDWVVAAPTEKTLFLIHRQSNRLNSVHLDLHDILPLTTNFAKRKILDLAIYYSEKKEEVSIYIYVMLEQAEKKFSIYEIKFLRTKNVDDIKNGTAERRSQLLLDPPVNAESQSTPSKSKLSKFQLGFDRNPFTKGNEEPRPVRIYIYGISGQKGRIFCYDLEKSTIARSNSARKVMTFEQNQVPLCFEACNTEVTKENTVERGKLAVVIRQGNAGNLGDPNIKIKEDVSKNSTALNNGKREVKIPGIYKCPELIRWHPHKDWLCVVSVKGDTYAPVGRLVCLFDLAESTRPKSDRSKRSKARYEFQLDSSGQVFVSWRPCSTCDPGSINYNPFQFLYFTSSEEATPVYLMDFRRSSIPIGVFKAQGESIRCISVNQNGRGMYAATIEGKVHYFAFKPNDALYSSVEDKLPKRAIAISPSGEIIQSVSVNKTAGKRSSHELVPTHSLSFENPRNYYHKRQSSMNGLDDMRSSVSSTNSDMGSYSYETVSHERGSSKTRKNRDDIPNIGDSAAGFVQDRTFTVIHSQPRPSAFGQFAELMRIPEGETPAVQAREIAQLAVQLGVINQDFYVRLADFLDGVPQTRIEEIPADLNVDKNAQNNESIENARVENYRTSPTLSLKQTKNKSSEQWREIPSEDSEAANTDTEKEEPKKRKQRCSPARDLKPRTSLMVIDSKELVSKAEVKTEEFIFRLFAQEVADIRTFECIQAAVIAVCILGEKIIKILESENVSSDLIESWFLEYFDYLSSRSLFIQKTLISRKCPIANIRELLYKPADDSGLEAMHSGPSYRVTYPLGCGHCRMQQTNEPGVATSCEKCKRFIICDVCKLPCSDSLSQFCRLCRHGGHVEHYEIWSQEYNHCMVAGCECVGH